MQQTLRMNISDDVGYEIKSDMTSIKITNIVTNEILANYNIFARANDTWRYCDERIDVQHQLRRLYLMEFYKDPWNGHEVIHNPKDHHGHILTIVCNLAWEIFGENYRKMYRNNPLMAYTQTSTQMVDGERRTFICKYTYSPNTNKVVTILKVVAGLNDCRSIELTHPLPEEQRTVPSVDELIKYHRKELDHFFSIK
jgi:hypothetical protein